MASAVMQLGLLCEEKNGSENVASLFSHPHQQLAFAAGVPQSSLVPATHMTHVETPHKMSLGSAAV